MTDISPDRFHGLSGLWKAIANFGVIGVVSALAVYVTTVTLPHVQREFHESLKSEREAARVEIKEERAAARAESQKSREHGDSAVKEIGDAVRELSATIIEVQAKTHANQERLIEIQSAKIKKESEK